MSVITYAIGDVHGCLPALTSLVNECRTDARLLGMQPRFVFLGDYVDRGPDTRGVIKYLRLLQSDHDVVALRGNHDEMLWRAILDHDPDAESFGVGYGAVQTLGSYGIHLLDDASDFASGDDVYQRISACDDLQLDCAWLRERPLQHEDHWRRYVHAGVNPLHPWDKQTPQDAMWIRAPFLGWSVPFEKYVVHGHTAIERVHVDRVRCNADTACVYGGRLTAVAFVPDQMPPTHCCTASPDGTKTGRITL